MGTVHFSTKAKLSTTDIAELKADVELLSIGMAYQVDGARELLQRLIQERTTACERKSTLATEQYDSDIRTLQRANTNKKPSAAEVANARQRLGADI